jgi:hypothetical protein
LVAEQEKEFVRSSAVTVLMQDPSDRVSLQAALLVSNIARFDVPRPWDTLLPDLSTASTIQHPSPWKSKFRALLALKHVLRALRTKRFIIEAPVQGSLGLLTPNQLESLGEALDHDRTTMYQQSKALLSILRVQWEGNFDSLLRGESGWDLHGKLAVGGLAALRELLMMLPDVRGVESELDALLNHGVEAASTLARYLFWGPTPRAAQLTDSDTNGQNRSDAHVLLASKCWERLLQCALVSMERHTVAFAKHVPRWAMSCVDTALVGMDAAAVHGIRAKARILLTRFVARAMLQPMYRREYGVGEVDGRAVSVLPSGARERMASALPDLIAASQALDSLVSETETERCRGFVEAIVSKYVVLAPDELAEWGSDPEGFARQVDLETSLDADTPRPCGIALMEALLERNEPVVSEALLNLARSLQTQPLTVQTVLAKEAMYRTLGECYVHIRTRINFQAWYFSELRAHLAEEQQQTGLQQAPTQTEIESGVTLSAVMKARSLWLVGVCGDELGMEAWKEAYALSVRHIASSDLVSSLMAVSATTALIAQTIEESVFVGGEDGRTRVGSQDSELGLGQGLGLGLGTWDRDKDRAFRGLDLNDGDVNLDGGGLLQFGMGTGMEGEDLQSFSSQPSPQELEYQAHRDAIEASLDALFNGCFGLLPRVEESESMVRILQCVSVAIELLGPAVGSHVGLIAAALPRVWGTVVADYNNNDNNNKPNLTPPGHQLLGQDHFSSKSAGRVRLHASLLAMLAHLLSKVGVAAVQESSGVVASVVLPLLAHATDISSSTHAPGIGEKEGENSSFSLLDDGIALWMATLQAVPSLTPPLVDLVTTRLGPLLARGKDPGPVLRIAEAYAIHSADALEPVVDVLAETVTSCLSAAEEAMTARRNTDTGMIFTSLGALSPETAKEAMHAALLLATLVRAKISQVSRLTDLGLQSGSPLAVVLGRLERPIMKAVALLATEYGGGVLRLPGKAIPILEPCLDILQHLTMVAPDVVFEMFMRLNATPPTDMTSNKSAVALGRVLDRWIALASARDVGEMFIPALAAVGRARRHSAAVALCALFLSDETAVRVGNGELVSATRNLHRAAQALALGLRAAIEQRAFELDQRYLADLRPGDPDHTDQLLLRRLLLARGDALRGVDAMDAVRAVAGHVAGWAGRDRIVAEVQSIDYMYGERLETILAGQLPESETDAAIASMQHAVLHE